MGRKNKMIKMYHPYPIHIVHFYTQCAVYYSTWNNKRIQKFEIFIILMVLNLFNSMAENKTTRNQSSVFDFLNGIQEEKKRQDALDLLQLFKNATGLKPEMWGPSIVGFGNYHYKYESGREGDFFLTGFSPRKQNLTIYIMPGFNRYPQLMKNIGKYKTGKSCLYVKKLEDIDREVLKKLIRESVEYMNKKYNS